ncbi:hypothetical protein D1007_42872 [Hordeum vulgare]|nr:hypothetical protein D1007_42872 [Hordeum vulgare]
MAVEKLPEVKPPSGRVLGRGLLALLILGAPRQRNDGGIHDSGSSGRVSDRRDKYSPKESIRGGGPHPGVLVAQPGGGPRRVAAWGMSVSPLAPLDAS